jgi:NADP-dependent 3-hydroxy acid dehydrogenase YdfG
MTQTSTALGGKVALVTGASSGIGRAVALVLQGAGMKVVVAARRIDRLQDIAERGSPDTVLPIACDLRDEQQIISMFATVRERWGGVDVLVNNAGLGRNATLCDGSSEDWREMLEVNVLALCICTREAVADMRRHGDTGHVVHISSMAAHRVPSGSGVYSATKFAVRSLTEGLRQELRQAGSGIRVSAVSPGFVETEFAEVFHHGDRTAPSRTYGNYPCLQPDDVAAAVRFVLTAPAHMQVHDLLVRPTAQPD